MGWKEKFKNWARLAAKHPLWAIAAVLVLGLLGSVGMHQAEGNYCQPNIKQLRLLVSTVMKMA